MKRVWYVGVVLSGRDASMRSVARQTKVLGAPTSDETTVRIFAPSGENQDVRLSVARLSSASTDALRQGREGRAEIAQLKEADGLIFVVDSQEARLDSQCEYLDELRDRLGDGRRGIDELAVVFQLNKRDLVDLHSCEALSRHLRTARCKYVESVAPRDLGTLQALATVLALSADPPSPITSIG